jgi:hypothetical protein
MENDKTSGKQGSVGATQKEDSATGPSRIALSADKNSEPPIRVESLIESVGDWRAWLYFQFAYGGWREALEVWGRGITASSMILRLPAAYGIGVMARQLVAGSLVKIRGLISGLPFGVATTSGADWVGLRLFSADDLPQISASDPKGWMDERQPGWEAWGELVERMDWWELDHNTKAVISSLVRDEIGRYADDCVDVILRDREESEPHRDPTDGETFLRRFGISRSELGRRVSEVGKDKMSRYLSGARAMPVSVLPKVLARGTSAMRSDIAGLIHYIAFCRRKKLEGSGKDADAWTRDSMCVLSAMLEVMPSDNPRVRWLVDATIADHGVN